MTYRNLSHPVSKGRYSSQGAEYMQRKLVFEHRKKKKKKESKQNTKDSHQITREQKRKEREKEGLQKQIQES